MPYCHIQIPRSDVINSCEKSVDTGTHLKLITCNIKHPLYLSFTSYPRAFSNSLGDHSVHGQTQSETKGELPPASKHQPEGIEMDAYTDSCLPTIVLRCILYVSWRCWQNQAPTLRYLLSHFCFLRSLPK